jgi:hypothetical protein
MILSIFLYIILDLHQKQVDQWKKHEIFCLETTLGPIYLYYII